VFGDIRTVLTDLWQQRWPDCPPVGYKLRDPYRNVWVRFHSLPESKRYAKDENEYAVVLERYNTVLDELFASGDVYVITPVWTTEADVPPLQPDAGYWQSLLVEDDPDPEFRTYCHLFAARRPWRRGCLDELLRDIADDKMAGVLVTHRARGTGSDSRPAHPLALQQSVGSLTDQDHHPAHMAGFSGCF
jgi:hypothetical protein